MELILISHRESFARLTFSAIGRAEDGDVTNFQDFLVLRPGVLAGGQERGRGGARSLSVVTLTFELISLLCVTNQCARRTIVQSKIIS